MQSAETCFVQEDFHKEYQKSWLLLVQWSGKKCEIIKRVSMFDMFTERRPTNPFYMKSNLNKYDLAISKDKKLFYFCIVISLSTVWYIYLFLLLLAYSKRKSPLERSPSLVGCHTNNFQTYSTISLKVQLPFRVKEEKLYETKVFLLYALSLISTEKNSWNHKRNWKS